MSIEFNNAYQEILIENVTAIIKQNFVLQTQIKLLEKSVEEKQALQNELNSIRAEMISLTRKNEELKPLVEQNQFLREEKERVQKALNDELKKNQELESKLPKPQAKKSTVKPQIKDEHRSVINRITPNTVLKTNVKEEKFVALKKNDGSSF